MTTIYLKKVPGGLIPNEDSDADVVRGWRNGGLIECKVSRPRNPQFHRKFFALINYGFECWEPEAKPYYKRDGSVHTLEVAVEKNFDRFRKDITIACGFRELVVNIKGDVRAEAKSISFASMDEDEFEALFNKAINYLIRMQILRNQTNAEVRAVVEERVNNLLAFA